MTAGEYSAEFDYCAGIHYDCNGLGRLHRRGAPAQICLSMPCAEKPSYRLPESNKTSFSIRPAGDENVGWNIIHEARTPEFVLTKWKVDGRESTRISHDAASLSVFYRGA